MVVSRHEAVPVGVDEVARNVLTQRHRGRTRQIEVALPQPRLRKHRRPENAPDLQAVARQKSPSAASTANVFVSSNPWAWLRPCRDSPFKRLTRRSHRR